jgi:hypothetical protein
VEAGHDPFGQTTPDTATPIEAGPSPLWPQHLFDLFSRPTRFFSSQLGLGRTPYILLATWCYGIASAMDRVDQELLRAEFGEARPSWDVWGPMVTQSWVGYWGFVLTMGVFGGLFLWWLGGWWYRVRLRWAGDPTPDPRLARLVYIYSSFVCAGPTVALALLQTALFENYAAAWNAEELYSSIVLVFLFWSLATSYLGARALFHVSRWRAQLWFLVLPAALYVIALGLAATLIALFAA